MTVVEEVSSTRWKCYWFLEEEEGNQWLGYHNSEVFPITALQELEVVDEGPSSEGISSSEETFESKKTIRAYPLKYKLGEQHPQLILYRVVALRDFSDVKKGDVGGWVNSEDNLSHNTKKGWYTVRRE